MELNIVTFNIRCFGFDGDYFGKNRTESRTPFLKNFIDSIFPDADIFVFQEIMNPLIIDKILPQGFKTYTYQHSYNRHMFIVFACKNEFDIQSFQTIANTALDDKRSRPAVYGQLVSNNKAILDLIGVHLKSKFDHTEDRNNQARVIAKFIKELNPKIPKVLTGDFNTHAKEKTFKSKDDLAYIEEILNDQLTLADHGKTTYLAADEEMKLDHFFTQGVQVLELKVYDLPDYAPTGTFKKYFNEISDHLPVSIKIKI